MTESPSPRPVLSFAMGCILAVAMTALVSCGSGKDELVLGATTTVQDPGLLDAIVKGFEADSGYRVKPIIGGSGQILETARRGEFDVIMTHSPADEQKFVADGEGLEPRKVMENFFLLAGPPDDPARVKNAATLKEAFQRIAEGGFPFISRGDGSGTNKRELSIWSDLKIDPNGLTWYQESAISQGQNLLVASDKGAYTLADSATFISFRDRVHLEQFVIDRERPNVYTVTLVNPEKHNRVNEKAARAFADFITGPKGQRLIEDFGRAEYGEPLFVPLALPSPTP